MPELVETRVGPLPRHWDIKPLADSTSKIQDGTHFSPLSEDGPCRYVTSRNVRPGRLDLSGCGRISQQEHDKIYARCDVRSGDVLLTKDGANTGNACLNTEIEPFSLLSSVAFLRTEGTGNCASFILQYLLSTEAQKRLKDLMAGNAIPRLTLQKIKAFETPIPPPHEQRCIAEILSTVDEAIEQTEALIAKTQQIKAGLMHDLFTRGVTPDGRLRPPRDEAPQLYKQSPLGWIPKEWEVSSLRQVAEIRTGIAKNAGRVLVKPATVQYLRVANVQDGFLDLTEMKTIQIEASDLERYQVLPNDVLMNEGGDLDKLGRGAIWPGSNEPCVHQNHVFVVRCGARVNPAFLNAWTGSPVARRYFMVAGKQTTNLASINKTQLGRLSVLVPPPLEQSAIARALETQEERLLSETEEIAKLRLLKAGLMHDLLTGRVRVPVAETQKAAASGGVP